MGETSVKPWVADDTACKLYLFDLAPLVSLGMHKPYYHAIGDVVNSVLSMNMVCGHDQLKIAVTDTCAEVFKLNHYITEVAVRDVERMCVKILEKIHMNDDNIVTHCRHIIKQNEIYIEVQKWT